MAARQTVGLFLGPGLFAICLGLPETPSLPQPALAVLAVTALMATWWMSEAIPIAATALVPIVLFPVLGVMPAAQVTAAYANHLIYLFMGGFLIAMAIEKWGLHRRIALHTIRLVGVTPGRIVLGFMLATGFLSAWISNTATVMLMVTIGMAVLGQVGEGGRDGSSPVKPFGVLLMLSIAYSASIGGVATLIGTPPNAILAGILEQRFGVAIGFAKWMAFGVPLSVAMLLLAWLYLTRLAYPVKRLKVGLGVAELRAQIAGLGPISPPERRVLVVFGLVVTGWLTRGFIDWPPLALVTDSTIAMAGALALFALPANWHERQFLLDWQTALRIPWEVILLFGGGFALAAGFADTGLTGWIGERLSLLEGVGLAPTVLVIVLGVVFLTEVTSNTATASLLLPVVLGFALGAGLPHLPLMVAVASAASYAFMLPVATPPNAIVFGSQQVSIPQMARAGFWLNLIGSALISACVVWLLPWAWGL